jgi:heat shock protein HtpX
VWEIIQGNKRKSLFLVFLMAVLLMLVGSTLGVYFADSYIVGLLIAFALWVFLSFAAYFQGKNIFLSISGAKKISKDDHPRLFNIVEEMKIASALPAMPDIYIIDDPAPNAFAVGRTPDSAAVAVTTGLLNSLKRDELQGVIAHEIGHIVNRDTLFMSMLAVMLGAIIMLAAVARHSLFFSGGRRRSRSSSRGGGQAQIVVLVVGLVLMILAPLLARLIYLAASRKREYLADASAAVFTRYPEGLASALEKISVSPVKMRKVNQATAPMFIINPMHKLHESKDSLFSTHPASSNRISILRSMAGGSGYLNYDQAYRNVTHDNRALIPSSVLKPEPQKDSTKKAPGKSRPDMTRMVSTGIMTGAIITDSAQPAEPETRVERVRETGDALWKSQGYKFISCDCGAMLKIPPDYKRQNVACLRCHATHELEE